jgi:hypothetical protein
MKFRYNRIESEKRKTVKLIQTSKIIPFENEYNRQTLGLKKRGKKNPIKFHAKKYKLLFLNRSCQIENHISLDPYLVFRNVIKKLLIYKRNIAE